jgi:mannose-6-phosphate isomerase-like protein (cupin superfamily)
MAKIVKFSETKKIDLNPAFSLNEYAHQDPEVDIVIGDTHGRNPEKGYLKNLRSKEVIYVLEGNGTLHLEDKDIALAQGDAIILERNEKFAFTGTNLKVVSVCVPALESDGAVEVE